MTVGFGVVVAIVTVSLDVGAASLFQFESVNQSLEVEPVHVSSALAATLGNPAMAVPASSSAASLAERCVERNRARDRIMAVSFQKDFRENRIEAPFVGGVAALMKRRTGRSQGLGPR
jgi:hypothetical protein